MNRNHISWPTTEATEEEDTIKATEEEEIKVVLF